MGKEKNKVKHSQPLIHNHVPAMLRHDRPSFGLVFSCLIFRGASLSRSRAVTDSLTHSLTDSLSHTFAFIAMAAVAEAELPFIAQCNPM